MNWTVLLSKENELFHVNRDSLRKWCTGVGTPLIYRSATSLINWEKNLSSRGGQLLWSTFGGHIKATGYLHNCSDFKKKNILSGKWCRKCDWAGRDSDSQLWEIYSHWTGIMIPDCEMNTKWIHCAIAEKKIKLSDPLSALNGILARWSPGEMQMYNDMTILLREYHLFPHELYFTYPLRIQMTNTVFLTLLIM